MMSRGAMAFAVAGVGFRPAANDNDVGRGDSEADRWRWLIERLKAIHPPSAILASALRLEGMSVDAFTRDMRRAMKQCGWPQAEDLED